MDPIPGWRLHQALVRIAEVTGQRPATGIRHDDDVGEEGTINSDAAAGFDPRHVLRALAAHGAPAIVIGQVAGILHGSAELTGDLDLLWSGGPEDAQRMAAAFTSLRAELFDDDHARIAESSSAFALPKALFRTSSASGDCCTPRLPWGDLDVEAYLRRAASTEIDRYLVRYVALDDLIAMRRASGRAKDLRRLEELERIRAGLPA